MTSFDPKRWLSLPGKLPKGRAQRTTCAIISLHFFLSLSLKHVTRSGAICSWAEATTAPLCEWATGRDVLLSVKSEVCSLAGALCSCSALRESRCIVVRCLATTGRSAPLVPYLIAYCQLGPFDHWPRKVKRGVTPSHCRPWCPCSLRNVLSLSFNSLLLTTDSSITSFFQCTLSNRPITTHTQCHEVYCSTNFGHLTFNSVEDFGSHL